MGAAGGLAARGRRRIRQKRLLADRIPSSVRFLGFIEASVVLAGVVVLFAAFVLVQFRYFFGGAENIGIQGYTFAEYARRGYGELMAVAFLSLLLLLALGAVTRRDSIRATAALLRPERLDCCARGSHAGLGLHAPRAV